MLYNPPTGGAANDSYVGANIAAGIQGSKVPPAAVEFPQRELVALITAAGLAPTNTDLTQVQRAVRSGILEYSVDTGAVNAPTIAPTPAHTTLVDGLHVRVRMKFAPTGPANFSISSLVAPIQRVGGAALIGGEWAANDVVGLVYNAARNAFQIAGITQNDLPAAALWHVGIDNSTSAAAITTTVAPAVPTRVGGLAYLIFPAHACAGATTLNVGFGASNLTRNDASPLQANDYAANQPLLVIDDGTEFRIVDLTPSQIVALIPTLAPSLSPPRNLVAKQLAGTYTFTIGVDCPNTTQWIYRQVVGAGGGGAGGGPNVTWASGGGGSGGSAAGWLQVQPGQQFTYVVGAGGLGVGNANGAVGNTGGTSSFGSSMYATGGSGGTGSNTNCSGGVPGVGSGGQENLHGSNGGDGNPYNSNVQGGNGAASVLGGGGRTATNNNGSVLNGVAPGSGGGGIWTPGTPAAGAPVQLGGNGADGAVFIQY